MVSFPSQAILYVYLACSAISLLFHLFHHCLAEFPQISPCIRHLSDNFTQLSQYRTSFKEHY